ncbi:hypothetical protein [Streptomyces sp. NPDC003863]
MVKAEETLVTQAPAGKAGTLLSFNTTNNTEGWTHRSRPPP